MRPNKMLFYCFLLSIWSLFLFYLFSFTLGRRTVNIYTKCEHKFYHNVEKSNLTFTNKTTILKQTPSLKWIKELNNQAALDTVPATTSPNCAHSVFLLVLVVSSPEHYMQRNAIRSSWAKVFHSNKSKESAQMPLGSYRAEDLVKTVFLLGKSDIKQVQGMVDYETELHDDIINGNFQDNYKNLVYKTRLGLTWAYAQCTSAYLLKTDDDVFVNVKQLVQWLWKSPEVANFYTGWCNYRSKVSRNKLSKWYVSVDEYYEDEFPPYCLGGGYLISSDIISSIIKPLYNEHVFPLEDIFVGVQINKLNIQPIDNRKYFNLLFAGVKDLCDYIDIFVLHPVQVLDLAEINLSAELARKVCK